MPLGRSSRARARAEMVGVHGEPRGKYMRFGRSRGSERDVEAEAARAAWPNGFRAAVSISFDDARRSQVELGLPLIDQMGIPATFYVLPDGVNQAPRGWHDLVASGHEVGNHTFMHPCSGNFAWSRHHSIED